MTKFNVLVLAVLAVSLSACGKSAAEKAIEGININNPPAPPAPPAPPRATKWTGSGSIKMTGMPEMACASVNVEIADDAAGFDLSLFNYDCSGNGMEMKDIRLTYQGNELFMGVEKVGQKQNNVVDFTLKDPSGAALGFRFLNDGTNLQTIHTMKANGFEQTLTATLHQ